MSARSLPNPARRTFLITGLTAGGGLLVGLPGLATDDAAPRGGRLGFYIEITADNRCIIGSAQPEIGQGVRTALPMLIAEELDVEWETVSVEQMPLGLLKTEDGFTWKYGGQGAGGSTAIIGNFDYLRQVGAGARELLIAAAAEQWSVDAATCRTESGHVLHPPSGRRIAYAELTAAAATREPPTEPRLKDPQDYRIVGTPRNVVDAHEIVTGQARYGIDTVRPGMRHAVIARSPYLDGTVKSFDDTAARQVPGVLDVFEIKGPEPGAPYLILASGVAVVAESTWAALKGREALSIEWNEGPHTDESTDSFWAQAQDLLGKPGQVVRDDGDFDEAVAAASKVIKARYQVPFVNHAPLEPQNCFCHVQDNEALVIAPTQQPAGASRAVAAVTGLPRENIRVEMTRVGGGFGRRLTNDYVAEAAMISQRTGAPIKLQWSREDDMQHDFFRPSGLHEMVAAVDDSGAVTAWSQRLASASKYYRRPNVAAEDMYAPELYVDDFPAGSVDNLRLEYMAMSSGVPRGSWRAPAHTANAWVIQSFIDEVAHATGQDPLALRIALYGEDRELDYGQHGGPTFNPYRLSRLVQFVAKEIGHGRSLPERRGIGLASHFTFGGYAAHACDVEVSPDGKLTIHRVVAAVDCGFVVNPRGVEAQLQGGTVDGLSTALGLEITVRNGQIEQTNFHDYPLLRMAQMPLRVDAHILPWGERPTGMGEMGIPTLAPALTNAIFNACGVRIRKLPLKNQLAEQLKA